MIKKGEKVIREKGAAAGIVNGIEVFNRAALMKRVMEDEELARGVIDRFLQDTPQRLAALSGALADGDTDLARRHAHTLKGSSAVMSAPALCEAAFRVEVAAESGDIAEAVSMLPDVYDQFEILKEIVSG